MSQGKKSSDNTGKSSRLKLHSQSFIQKTLSIGKSSANQFKHALASASSRNLSLSRIGRHLITHEDDVLTPEKENGKSDLQSGPKLLAAKEDVPKNIKGQSKPDSEAALKKGHPFRRMFSSNNSNETNNAGSNTRKTESNIPLSLRKTASASSMPAGSGSLPPNSSSRLSSNVPEQAAKRATELRRTRLTSSKTPTREGSKSFTFPRDSQMALKHISTDCDKLDMDDSRKSDSTRISGSAKVQLDPIESLIKVNNDTDGAIEGVCNGEIRANRLMTAHSNIKEYTEPQLERPLSTEKSEADVVLVKPASSALGHLDVNIMSWLESRPKQVSDEEDSIDNMVPLADQLHIPKSSSLMVQRHDYDLDAEFSLDDMPPGVSRNSKPAAKPQPKTIADVWDDDEVGEDSSDDEDPDAPWGGDESATASLPQQRPNDSKRNSLSFAPKLPPRKMSRNIIDRVRVVNVGKSKSSKFPSLRPQPLSFHPEGRVVRRSFMLDLMVYLHQAEKAEAEKEASKADEADVVFLEHNGDNIIDDQPHGGVGDPLSAPRGSMRSSVSASSSRTDSGDDELIFGSDFINEHRRESRESDTDSLPPRVGTTDIKKFFEQHANGINSDVDI